MSVLSELGALVGAGFEAAGLDSGYGEVSVSNRPDLGQFQCNGALAAARRAGRNPRAIADAAAAEIASDPRLAHISVAGPGFLNLTLTDEAVAGYMNAMAGDPRLGAPPAGEPLVVVVDYAGPKSPS